MPDTHEPCGTNLVTLHLVRPLAVMSWIDIVGCRCVGWTRCELGRMALRWRRRAPSAWDHNQEESPVYEVGDGDGRPSRSR